MIAGDTVQWTKSLPDFLSSAGWTLSYRLFGSTGSPAAPPQSLPPTAIVTTANTSGGFDVVITPTAWAQLFINGDTCRLMGWVTNVAGERHTVYEGNCIVTPNVALGGLKAFQTPNQRILAAIDARLEDRMTADQESVQINGTMLTRIPIEKLAALRGAYVVRVWRDLNPGRSFPSHEIRFRNAH